MTTNTITQKLLEDLKSPERSVRYLAADNPNATPQVLLIAMKDEDYFVRRAAKWAIEENPLLALQIAALQAKNPS